MNTTELSLQVAQSLRGPLSRAIAVCLLISSAATPCWAETKTAEWSTESTKTTESGNKTQTTTTKTSGSKSVDDGTAARTANGGELTASLAGEQNTEVNTEYSNCGEDDLGGTELQSGKTVWNGSVDLLNESGSVGGENANAGYGVQATANGQVQIGKNGVQASGDIGIEAELHALAQFEVGDENFGGGGAAEGTVNAILKAQGTVGAYIDEKGLTIGLDAKAEAMVSAEASLSLNLKLFGIQTTVTATAKGQAGASASASAVITIGFDGKINFKLGAGATAGLGGGVYFNASVDAQQLMQQLGFESLDQLIEWCEKLADDPEALAQELSKEAAKKAASQLASEYKDEAVAAAKDLAQSVFSLAGNMLSSAGSLPGGSALSGLGGGLQSLFGGGSSSGGPVGSGMGGGGTGGGGGGGGGAGPAGSGTGTDYQRDSQYNKWSK